MLPRYLLFLAPFTLPAAAQTTLFSEDFESAPAFTLNTTDAGSTVSTWNTWVVNNSYTGGNGDVVCLGFPFPYTIVSTAGQPAGITTPNGNYLHTASVEGITDGILCCSFGAADGFCITADNTFSRMTGDVSTVGFSDVDFSFWWLCAGSTTHFGQVYYSINGGSNWNLISVPITNYNNQTAWVQQTISDPAFGNQSTLRFGFKFVNSIGGSALDPGFGIDDVAIVGQSGAVNTVSCTVTPSAVCAGSGITVDCSATGTYNAGNVFEAQLSNALGSFAAPTVIGSIAATTSVSFGATIPGGTPAGNGYLVRVVSSNPVVTGTSSAAFSVQTSLSAGTNGQAAICCNAAPVNLFAILGGTPDAGGTWTDPNGVPFPGSFIPCTSLDGAYTYTVGGSGCPPSSATVTLTSVPTASAGLNSAEAICNATGTYSLMAMLGGSPDAGGVWTNPNNQVVSDQFDSAGQPGGNYTYTVQGQAPCTNAVAVVTITLVDPANAGVGSTQLVCSTSSAQPLIGFLSSSPDATGYWLDPSDLVTDQLFDPAIDAPGLYTYVVAGQGACPNDSAYVEVQIVTEPDAGSSSTATICVNDPPVDLITLLGGTPDVGGSWTGPNSQPHGPQLNPAIDPAGLYTYTVDPGAPCVSASASVAVIIDPCTGIDELQSGQLQLHWLGTDGAGQHFITWTGTASCPVAHLRLMDAQGKLIVNRSQPVIMTSSGGGLLLDTGTIMPGAYVVSVECDGMRGTVPIVQVRR